MILATRGYQKGMFLKLFKDASQTVYVLRMNLTFTMKHCNSDYHADDATVHTLGNTQNVTEFKLQQDGNNTKLWCKQIKMGKKYDKTTCMIVGTEQKYPTFKHLH